MEGDKYWRGTAGFIDTTAVKLQSKRPLKLHIRKNCPRIYDFMGRGISIRNSVGNSPDASDLPAILLSNARKLCVRDTVLSAPNNVYVCSVNNSRRN